MKVVYYTLESCKDCAAYGRAVEAAAKICNYEFESVDIDSDAERAVAVLREYRGITDLIPFFAIFDQGGTRINTYDGRDYCADELIQILIKHDRRYL